jgi:hypothetical protein
MEQKKHIMKSKTETLVAALRILANDIQSPDDIPATCLREAADRLEELEKECNMAVKALIRESCDRKKMMEQRDEIRAEVERLKAELHDTIESYKLNNLQPKTTRPEPSRLEIAAWLKAGWFANRDADFNAADHGWWVEQADKLIAAAREAK